MRNHGSGPIRLGLVLPGLALLVTGCGALQLGPSFGAAPAECGFPPATELAWSGTSSVRQLGLDQGFGNDPLRNQPVQIYITADAIRIVPDDPLERHFCFLVPPGAAGGARSVQHGAVPDDWVQPAVTAVASIEPPAFLQQPEPGLERPLGESFKAVVGYPWGPLLADAPAAALEATATEVWAPDELGRICVQLTRVVTLPDAPEPAGEALRQTCSVPGAVELVSIIEIAPDLWWIAAVASAGDVTEILATTADGEEHMLGYPGVKYVGPAPALATVVDGELVRVQLFRSGYSLSGSQPWLDLTAPFD
jgi:hypothetical protein